MGKIKTTFEPTDEQKAIVEAFNKTRVLKVNAYAGSGKSSTLKLLSEANDKPSLYVAFNKVIVEEAVGKFPEHVACKTAHSLAYGTFGRMLQAKLARQKDRGYVNVAGTASEIALKYKVVEYPVDADVSIPSGTLAKLAKDTVDRFQNTADEKISTKHVGYYDVMSLLASYPTVDEKDFILKVYKIAVSLWKDRIDPMSNVLANHDTYLKMWQLSKPVLNYDIIYFDESQDASPVILDVLQRQTHCKICYVGDTYQSIYAFRGAINAMDLIDAPTKYLSKSFRFGESVADLANNIISVDDVEVKGNESICSYVSDEDSMPKTDTFKDFEYTYIFRTNTFLFNKALELYNKGVSFYCEVDAKGMIKKLESALALFEGNHKKVKHEDIMLYPTWLDLLNASDEDVELKRIARIVETNKAYYMIKALQDNKMNSKGARVILTTAHKAKGKEWNNVLIAEDFKFEKTVSSDQERNLFYVACTRAIKNLYLPMFFFETTKD